jgi:hypothetical protein
MQAIVRALADPPSRHSRILAGIQASSDEYPEVLTRALLRIADVEDQVADKEKDLYILQRMRG